MIAETDALPQFAGTRQKVASVWLETDGKNPVRILKTEGSIWTFDREGGIREGLNESFAEVMRSILPPGQENQTVVELAPRLSKKKIANEYRWELKKTDVDRIIRDIWPKHKSDSLKQLKGVSPRKPSLTFDARRALDEIAEGFWKTTSAIDRLKEPSLKGFIFEAQQRSRDEPDYDHLYQAVAETAKRSLEIARRRRSGKGVWYALVEIMEWRGDGITETIGHFYEKCLSRSEAVAAARRLLAEHAHNFGVDVTVEAEIMTDLEWNLRPEFSGE